MRWNIVLVAAFFCIGCGVAKQPASIKTVAAYEIPLATNDDRREFLTIFSDVAEAEGFHVDAATDEELQRTSGLTKLTINAAIWRGTNDEESLVHIMDAPDHPAWLVFSKGENPAQSVKLKLRLMERIEKRWPGTLKLPIMPTGAIPLAQDLVRTADGYVVSPAARSKYQKEAKAHPD